MAKIALALAARGTDEEAFKAWGTRAVGAPNTKQWGSGKELLTHMVNASNGGGNCIERLYIFSHAWPYIPGGNRGGVKLGGVDVAGFYSQPSLYDDTDARYINDFAQLVQEGKNNLLFNLQSNIHRVSSSIQSIPSRISACQWMPSHCFQWIKSSKTRNASR